MLKKERLLLRKRVVWKIITIKIIYHYISLYTTTHFTKTDMSERDLWLRKRKRTFIGFVVQTLALGMEYSLTFITLWMYLKEVLKTEYLLFFYSAISSVYLISQVVMSVILGAVFDRYRNTRLLLALGNTLVIIGNVLYTIPYSPWFLFGGRLLSGGGGFLRSIMTSEIVRVYPDTELSKKFSIIGLAFALGFVFGPLLNIPFARLHFKVLSISVSFANAPGLILTVVFTLVQIVTLALVRNLSKEYDLKKERTSSDFEPLLQKDKPEMLEMEETAGIQNKVFEDSFSPFESKEEDIEQVDNDKETRMRAFEQKDLSPADDEKEEEVDETVHNERIFEDIFLQNVSEESAEDEEQDTEMTTFLFENQTSHSMFESSSHTSHLESHLESHDESEREEQDRVMYDLGIFTVFMKMVRVKDVLLILLLSFLFTYCMVLFDLWLPMAATGYLGYDVMEINLLILGFGACAIAQLILFTWVPIPKKKLNFLAMFCFIGMALDFVIFVVLKHYHSNGALNVVLLVVWDILGANVIAMEEIFLIVTLAPMVSTRVQATSESIRLAFSRSGAVVALLTAAPSFSCLDVTAVICVILLAVSFLVLVRRGKEWQQAKIMIE